MFRIAHCEPAMVKTVPGEIAGVDDWPGGAVVVGLGSGKPSLSSTVPESQRRQMWKTAPQPLARQNRCRKTTSRVTAMFAF